MTGEKKKDRYVGMLAQRQCALHTAVSCQMSFLPEGQESAGLAVVQAMNHQMHLERVKTDDRQILRLVLYTSDFNCPPYFPGFESTTHREVLAEVEWNEKDIVLEIEMDGEMFTFRYGVSKEALHVLCMADGGMINPEKVGCMTGTVMGMYASGNGTDSDNHAEFDWFTCVESE